MPVKYFIRTGWALLMLLSLFIIYNNAFRYFNFSSPAYSDDLKPFAGVLIIHISAGMIALLTGPLQFIKSLRKKYIRLHRITGRVYMGCVLIGGTSGLYLAIFHLILTVHYVTFGTGLSCLSIAWLTTSGMGLSAVLHKNFQQHRELMIRSYTVTCAFTTFRLLFALIENVLPVEKIDAYNICSWSCWAVPLLVVEVILQSKKQRPLLIQQASI